MKKHLAILALLNLASLNLQGNGLSEDRTSSGLKLRIDAEIPLTDKNGVVSPEQVANVPVGKLVCIYLPTGACYHGQITEIEESSEHYKVYGKIFDKEDSSFGFALVKGGHFAGAIVHRKENITYAMEFSKEHKGYIFLRSTQYDKVTAEAQKLKSARAKT